MASDAMLEAEAPVKQNALIKVAQLGQDWEKPAGLHFHHAACHEALLEKLWDALFQHMQGAVKDLTQFARVRD